MGRFLLGFLIFLTCTSESFAYGSIAFGFSGNAMRFAASQNELTASAADAVALQRCRAQGWTECKITSWFQNKCASIVLVNNYSFTTSVGTTAAEARANGFRGCPNSGTCTEAVTVCDSTRPPPTVAATPTPETDEDSTPPKSDFSWFGDPFFRGLVVAIGSAAIAGVIVSLLFLWMFASVFLPTPSAVLKRKAAISAWIGTPAAVTLLLKFFFPHLLDSVPFFHIALLFLWTNVFAALALGVTLRKRIFPRSPAPDPLSLPLATLAFSIFAAGALYLFIEHGIIANPGNCLGPISFFSACALHNQQEVLFATAALLLLTLVGVVLPADSNLILAYNRLNGFARRALSAIGQHSDSPWEQAGNYPPPALFSQEGTQLTEDIPFAASSGPMMLKIKKSQTRNLWGTVVFIIDARMEISPEEWRWVEKYRLGEMLIYSSSARDRHREAIKGHLEGTKGHPVFTLSIKDQFMGVLKTFFGFAMAGAHAAMAAYHLKITVYKLTRGVHVRCKDMSEVMVARRSIIEAGENLRAYLDVAQSFDGMEEILEF